MTNWPTKKLGEVLEINYGKGLHKDNRIDSGKYLAYGSNGPVYGTNESLTNSEIIVIGRKGTAGALYFVSKPCWPIDTTFFAKPKNDASLKFIYYLLQTRRLPRLAIVTGVPGINRTTLANIKVQLPPLAIQKQIVERMDKIAEAQKLNDELIQKSYELFGSIFYQEFQSKSDKWKNIKLEEVCEMIEQKHPKEIFKDFFTYIDIASIDKEGVIKVQIIPVKNAPSRARKLVQVNDTIFSTVRPYLKHIAFIPTKLNGSIASTGFCVIRPKTKITDPFFINYVVESDYFINKILPFQRGASYPAVSDKDIYNQKIALPSLKEQKQIVAKLSVAQEYKKQLLSQKSLLKELFDSVLYKSMKGELSS